MTTKRYPIYIDIINFILIHIIITSIDMLISTGMGMSCTAYELISFAVIILVSYLAREYISRLWIYLPVNAAMFALCAMSGQPDLARVKVGIVVLLFSLLNVNYWTNGRSGTLDIHYGVTAAVAVAYIFCEQRDNSGYAGTLYMLCVVFVLLQMAKMLLVNYYELALSGQLTDDMPVREIYRNNTMGAAVVMILTILAMMLVKAEGLIAFIKGLWFRLASGIGTLFTLETVEEVKEIESRPVIDIVPPIPEKGGILEVILHYIELALYAVTVATLIYGLIKLVIYIVKNLSRRDLERPKYNTFAGENEFRERISRYEDSEAGGFGWFKSPTDKIRAMYRKRLRSLKKSGSDIRETMTPRENSQSALKNSHDITDATAMYEYVRYSANPSISKEDVVRFKQLIK